MERFIVKVGPDGTFYDSGQIKFYPVEIDNFFLRLQDRNIYKTPPKSITLYFHGGLVSEQDGLIVANNLADKFISAGTIPVFFIWETSIKEAISSRLVSVTGDPVCKDLTRILLKIISEKLWLSVGDSLPRGNGLSDDEIDKQLDLERPFDKYKTYLPQTNVDVVNDDDEEEDMHKANILEADLELAVDRCPGLLTKLQASLDVKDETERDVYIRERGGVVTKWVFKKLSNIVFKVIKRFRNGSDHGFYPTVVEEIIRELYIAGLGAWVWDAMKTKAINMWKDNDGREGGNQFVGSCFLAALQHYLKLYPTTQVNLIGHSAGTISICHLLSAARERFPELIFQSVIFLAPACRIDLFHKHVVRYPDRFVKFRCFTMTDENECKDQLVPYVYNRSLLYLVSGILEDEGKKAHVPILGLHRFLNNKKTPNASERLYLDETARFMLQNDRLVLAATEEEAGPGFRTIALKHGDFDDDLITIESIKHMIGS